MNAIQDPFFWIMFVELVVIGLIISNQDLFFHIVERFELTLRIGFATFLLFISFGAFHSTITIRKDGEIIEEYEIK